MIDRSRLLRDLRQMLHVLERDLRTTFDGEPTGVVTVTESATAWLLATVFIRFCEDNGLIDVPFLAGPADRLSLARERQVAFHRRHPGRTDLDWIAAGFDAVSTSPATLPLFDSLYDMMTRLPISSRASSDLISFWCRTDEDGRLIHDFTDQRLDTGFLADLYANLSEAARAEYALIETPGFVADMILDHTLTPAVQAFGLPGLRFIDPACGSGTFALDAFGRLRDAWRAAAPDASSWDHIRCALTSIHGVDKNPIAVFICRFRLLMAAVAVAGAERLSEVPGLPIVIAVGDSLMPGRSAEESTTLEQSSFPMDAADAAINLLGAGSYDVVVSNPPYVTVKNPAEQEAYRSLYPVCRGKYSFVVPFVVRFFDLARSSGERAGFVGTLVANSFAKREFGRLLVEGFLPTVDLTHVVDTSGAYIPGHGTPHCDALWQARAPERQLLRTIAGVRGEPAPPTAGQPGVVWKAIADQIDKPGSESEWVIAADYGREQFAKHPWSLSGSNASGLLQALEKGVRLGAVRERIGYYATTGSDDAFLAPLRGFQRYRAEAEPLTLVVTGSEVRDWVTSAQMYAFFPGMSADRLIDISVSRIICGISGRTGPCCANGTTLERSRASGPETTNGTGGTT